MSLRGRCCDRLIKSSRIKSLGSSRRPLINERSRRAAATAVAVEPHAPPLQLPPILQYWPVTVLELEMLEVEVRLLLVIEFEVELMVEPVDEPVVDEPVVDEPVFDECEIDNDFLLSSSFESIFAQNQSLVFRIASSKPRTGTYHHLLHLYRPLQLHCQVLIRSLRLPLQRRHHLQVQVQDLALALQLLQLLLLLHHQHHLR